MRRLAAKALLVLATVSMAMAGPISINLDSVVPNGPNFTWTYTVSLAVGESFAPTQPEDFLSLLDWAGYVPGTAGDNSGGLFTFSYILVDPVSVFGPNGATTPDPLPAGTDNPAIGNLFFEHTGAVLPGPTSFQIFADSIYSQITQTNFHAQLRDQVEPTAGFLSQRGPVSAPEAATVIPEPSTLLLGGLGLGAIVLGSLRRRKK